MREGKRDTRELDAGPPHRLWMGCANDDQEHAVWFDPDEGGTEYVRVDLFATERAAREEAERKRDEWRAKAEKQTQAAAQHFSKSCQLADRALSAEARAENAERETARKCAETADAAVAAGWNACRKSIYAVCEDVQDEADRLRITGAVGTASEVQHAKGYHAGTRSAAKSIARGFKAMEAQDDDNVTAALAAIREAFNITTDEPRPTTDEGEAHG